MKAWATIAIAVAAALFSLPGVACAATPSKASKEASRTYNLQWTLPTAGKSGCMVCHGDPGLQKTSGETTSSLYVEQAVLDESAHPKTLCTGCHVDFAAQDAARQPPGRLRLAQGGQHLVPVVQRPRLTAHRDQQRIALDGTRARRHCRTGGGAARGRRQARGDPFVRRVSRRACGPLEGGHRGAGGLQQVGCQGVRRLPHQGRRDLRRLLPWGGVQGRCAVGRTCVLGLSRRAPRASDQRSQLAGSPGQSREDVRTRWLPRRRRTRSS